jgi:ATP-dependent Clp protease ATP-binding subunit ClpB
MTSNIGLQYIQDVAGDDSKYEPMRDRVMEAMRANFPSEFLNRVDEIIIFHSLRVGQLPEVVKLQVHRLEQRLGDHKLSLRLSDEALNWIALVGYDPIYSVRPLKDALDCVKDEACTLAESN